MNTMREGPWFVVEATWGGIRTSLIHPFLSAPPPLRCVFSLCCCLFFVYFIVVVVFFFVPKCYAMLQGFPLISPSPHFLEYPCRLPSVLSPPPEDVTPGSPFPLPTHNTFPFPQRESIIMYPALYEVAHRVWVSDKIPFFINLSLSISE